MSAIRTPVSVHRRIWHMVHHEHMSERQIMALTHVSRDTIRRLKNIDPDNRPAPVTKATKRPRVFRCPHCGARVIQKCLACRLRGDV